MASRRGGAEPAGPPPDPQGIRTVAELTARLDQLRAWAGLGYREVHRRVARQRAARGVSEPVTYNTVYRCMRPGRTRLDVDLLVDVVRVLIDEPMAATAWRLAYQLITGQSRLSVADVSASLPDDTATFTGRRSELERVLSTVTTADGADTRASVVLLEGMAGVGKTTLAVHAAHRLREPGRLARQQLWVNLRGYDPDQPPTDPSAVLEGFLRLLGVRGDRIYHLDLSGRSALFRQLLAGKPIMIVLDNAASEQQLRPLLPLSPNSLTLITSRHAVPRLAGAHRVKLEAFSEREAIEVLGRAIGAHRVDAEPDTAARIAASVGHLPLALGLVAGRINDSPDWTLNDHLSRLTERRRQRRLDSAVELALDLSYNSLRPDVQQTMRLLSQHVGGDVDVYAAAALAGADLAVTRQHLDELEAANLVQRARPARYQFHDLVRIYAGSCAIDREPEISRRDAVTRLFAGYLYTALQAMDIVYPFERHRRPCVPVPAVPVPQFASTEQARTWLADEHPNLVASVIHAAQRGWPTHATLLSKTLWRWLALSGRHGDALIIHEHAFNAARTSGDRGAEAEAVVNLGGSYVMLSQNDLATRHLRSAVEVGRQIGDRLIEARAHGGLGLVSCATGRYGAAIDHFLIAESIYRDLADHSAHVRVLNNLGYAHAMAGRRREAVHYYERVVGLSRESGDQAAEGLALGNLAENYAQLGRLDDARECYQGALDKHLACGHRAGEAHVLSLSHLVWQTDRPDLIDVQERAVTIAHDIGDTGLEALMRNRLADALRAVERPEDARSQYENALGLARAAGDCREQADAHRGLGHAMLACGDRSQACTHWRHALAIYCDLNLSQADEVQALLAAHDTAGHDAQT